jgi:Tfp pilus assembly protein PilV
MKPGQSENARHRSGYRSLGARRRRSGFTLVETLVATAIMFTGAIVMISVLPNLLSMSVKRTSRDNSYIYAQSLIDSMLVTPWSKISTSASGDFKSLLPDAPDAGMYRWVYTSKTIMDSGSAPTDGLLKKVDVGIYWSDNDHDTFVTYIANYRHD